MFDLESLQLGDSIARYNQNAMLEAQRIEEERKRQQYGALLEGLASQYESLSNDSASKVLNRINIVEGASIYAVQNLMYQIFEASLLLDEDAKEYYGESLRAVFDYKFNQLLEDSGIKTLRQFHDMIKESQHMLPAALETAHKFAQNNEPFYRHLLETHYNSTSTFNLIIDTHNLLAEDATDSQKIAAIEDIADKIIKGLMNLDMNDVVKQGSDVKQLISLAIKAVKFNLPILDGKVMVAVVTYLSMMQQLQISNNAYQIKNFPRYVKEMAGIKTQLIGLLDKLDIKSHEYRQIQKQIERIDSLTSKMNSIWASVNNVLEESTSQLLVETEQALFEENDNKIRTLFSKIIARIKGTLDSFDPYKGLEELKLANKVIAEQNQYQYIGSFGITGGTWVYLITKALKTKLPESLRNQYIREAEKFRNGMDKVMKDMKRDGRDKDYKRLSVQYNKLSKFLDNYKDETSSLVRETDEPLTDMIETSMDMVHYIQMYETSVEDIETMMDVLGECDEDELEDKELLLGMVQTKVDHKTDDKKLTEKCSCMEAVLYEKIFSHKLDFISEEAHSRMVQGQYPLPEQFLDEDEKKMIDDIAKIRGKEQAVDIIKSKVISVIENEEKRTREKEEEEEALLSRLSHEKIEEMKSSIEESSGVRLGSSKLNIPETLFESIVMNRSRKYIQEATNSGSNIDIVQNKDTILSESIVLYTIHETFNTLRFGDNSIDRVNKLQNDYYYGKI